MATKTDQNEDEVNLQVAEQRREEDGIATEPVPLNQPGVSDGDAWGGWTAQHGRVPPAAIDTGPKVMPHQLPDPQVARDAGITPQAIPPTMVEGGLEALESVFEDGVPRPPRQFTHPRSGESWTPENVTGNEPDPSDTKDIDDPETTVEPEDGEGPGEATSEEKNAKKDDDKKTSKS